MHDDQAAAPDNTAVRVALWRALPYQAVPDAAWMEPVRAYLSELRLDLAECKSRDYRGHGASREKRRRRTLNPCRRHFRSPWVPAGVRGWQFAPFPTGRNTGVLPSRQLAHRGNG